MAKKSNGPSSRLIIWGVVALAVVGVLIWKSTQPDPSVASATADPAVGKKLAVVELEPLTGDGKAATPESINGKVVMINYWEKDCEICMREFPHVVDLWDRYRGKPDVLFLSVSTTGDTKENIPLLKERIAEFLKAKGVTMPTYADPNGATQGELAKLFDEAEIQFPATVMLDREGKIRAVWRGYAAGDEQAMEQVLSNLLAESR
jgi:peroxiredoxin